MDIKKISTTACKHNIKQLYYFFGLMILSMVLYAETFISMPKIWLSSDTFAHGFLILPISAYLIWEKRALFCRADTRHNYALLIILGVLVFAWLVADSVDVLIGKQLMLVLMLPVLVGIYFGTGVLKLFLFPLLYLLFAVPLGDELVPKLQEITAYITVLGLQLSGIPVYREALYISVPAGDFEVAVACSGVRYLIASLALGTLYAYLTYSKLYKRVVFTFFAIIVPIVANGIRAYGIVMIAQLSDMQYATGVDHLIYGWFFFGIVIFFLFYIGNFWKDEQVNTASQPSTLEAKQESNLVVKELTSEPAPPPIKAHKFTALWTVAIVLAMGPLAKLTLAMQEPEEVKNITLPKVVGTWQLSEQLPSKWRPQFQQSDLELRKSYLQGTKNVDLYLAYYATQKQGKELVNSLNQLYDLDHFKVLEQNQKQLMIGGAMVNFDEYVISRGYQKRLVWGWYYVFGKSLNNTVEIKIHQAIGKVTGLAIDGSYIAFSLPFDEKENAEIDIQEFLNQAWPKIKTRLNRP